MSSLHPSDRDLHYEDGSHRWSGAPHGTSVEAWRERVRAHKAEHLAELRAPRHRRGRRLDRAS